MWRMVNFKLKKIWYAPTKTMYKLLRMIVFTSTKVGVKPYTELCKLRFNILTLYFCFPKITGKIHYIYEIFVLIIDNCCIFTKN